MMQVLYSEEKFAPLKDFQKLLRIIRTRRKLMQISKNASREMDDIQAALNRMKADSAIGCVGFQKYGRLYAYKGYGLTRSYGWSIIYTMKSEKEIYPGFAINYYRAMMQKNNVEKKLRLINVYLTSGKCIKYSV